MTSDPGEDQVREAASKALVVAAALADTLSQLSDRLSKLQKSKASKRLVIGMIASVVLDICLSVAVIFLGLGVVNTQDIAHRSAMTSCQQSNVSRLEDIAIWNRLLTVPGTPTAAQAKEIAELEHLVKIKDAPRICK
jgi:hypothetical protein